MSTDHPIVLGIGATKAGTSWLYAYLASHPDCSLRAVKELHYFNTLDYEPKKFEILHRAQIATMKKRSRKLRNSGLSYDEVERTVTDQTEWMQSRRRNDGHQSYMDYICSGAAPGQLVGDITPAYSFQSDAVFAQMRDLAADVRFIYLIRDPVDRVWSHIRMSAKRLARKKKGDIETIAFNMADEFLANAKPTIAVRSDYAATLKVLGDTIPQDQVCIQFFEDLFVQSNVDKITDFLGIRRHPATFDKSFNKGLDVKLDAARKKALIAHLQPQYAYVDSFFSGKLPERWQARMAAV